jgi:hypothetical protein
MIPKHIQNFGFLKMLLRSLTTALLNVFTLKKISANAYSIKKYKLSFIKPVIKILSDNHIRKNIPAMVIKVDFFLLNNPQL